MIAIELEQSSDGSYFVSWSCSNTELFDMTKAAFCMFVSSADRRYISEVRAWCVAPSGRDTLRLFLRQMEAQHGARIEGYDGSGDALADAYRTLHLTPDAPAPVVRACFKALLLLHDPERGGSAAKLEAINAAYAEIMNAQPHVRAA